MFNDGRFSKVAGEDYDIFYKASPYLLELQERVGVLVKEYINKHWPSDFSGPIIIYEGGCGTGTTTRVLLDVDKRIQVVAIDNERLMLNQMRNKFKTYHDRITFVHDDALHAIKASKGIDIFVSSQMIHNMQPAYRKSLIQELGRVMTSGGFFINFDKIARNDEVLHKKDYAAEVELIQYFSKHGQPELTKEWEGHYIEDDKIRFTEKEQADLLKEAGFVDIEFFSRHLFGLIATAKKI